MSLVKSLAQMTQAAEDTNVAMCSIANFIEPGADPNDPFDKAQAMQYFPESIKISRSTDYASKKPIGGSHPVYQWIHGGERTLSFDAVFTAEVDLWKQEDTGLIASAEAVGQAVGNFLKNPLSAGAAALRGKPDYGPNHVDVAAGVSWLMSKTYPSYSKTGRASPPPKLEIYLPNSGVATYIKGVQLADTFFCIMTRCSVNYTAFFRSGAPRIAEVSMDFDEIIQVGSQWGFVPRQSFAYNAATLKKANDLGIKAQTMKTGYTKNDPNFPPKPRQADNALTGDLGLISKISSIKIPGTA